MQVVCAESAMKYQPTFSN